MVRTKTVHCLYYLRKYESIFLIKYLIFFLFFRYIYTNSKYRNVCTCIFRINYTYTIFIVQIIYVFRCLHSAWSIRNELGRSRSFPFRPRKIFVPGKIFTTWQANLTQSVVRKKFWIPRKINPTLNAYIRDVLDLNHNYIMPWSRYNFEIHSRFSLYSISLMSPLLIVRNKWNECLCYVLWLSHIDKMSLQIQQ